jgi:sortase (surface protein transpeptidase)
VIRRRRSDPPGESLESSTSRRSRIGESLNWLLVGAGIVLLVVAGLAVVAGATRSASLHGGRTLPPPGRSRSTLQQPGLAPTPVPARTAWSGSAISLSGAPTGGAPATGRALEAPTQIEVPAIGLHSRVVPLGQNPDGSAMVPSGTSFTGWYDLGPVPGDTGPAVIMGHVDSTTGPGVFFNLRYLLPGDLVTVDDGSRAVSFRVERVVVYPKDAFPTAEVFGPTPDVALRLITCGGPFDTSIGHYEDDVVVYADAAAASSTGARPTGAE